MSMDIQIKSLQNSLSAAASNMAAWRRQAEAEEKMNMDRKVAEAEEEWRSLQEELRAAWAEDERGRMEELVVGLEGPREPYAFKSSAAINKNENDPSDAFERGVSSFEAGEIADAISAFEEVLNLDQSNAKAWRYLGRCHQEVDSDADAITCFEHAVQVDPYDLDSLLNLGVSYVNEMDQARALRSIRGWLAGNPAYSHLSGPSELHESANPELQLESQSPVEQDPLQSVVAGRVEPTRTHVNLTRPRTASVETPPQGYTSWETLVGKDDLGSLYDANRRLSSEDLIKTYRARPSTAPRPGSRYAYLRKKGSIHTPGRIFHGNHWLRGRHVEAVAEGDPSVPASFFFRWPL